MEVRVPSMKTISRKAVLVVLVAIGAILTKVNGKPPNRLRGGEDAVLGDHPWIVAIGPLGAHLPFCGGAIINPRYILTAAHCVADEKPGDLIIRSGLISIYDKNSVVSDVAEYIVHPDYRPQTEDGEILNHIAILKLKGDLPIGNRLIKTIPLASKQPGDQYGVFAGWGDLTETAKLPTILQTAVVKVQNAEDCAKQNSEIVLPQILCGSIKNGNTFVGDSESPLVCNGEVVGVLSLGYGDRDSVDFYTNVYYYLDWIKSVIG